MEGSTMRTVKTMTMNGLETSWSHPRKDLVKRRTVYQISLESLTAQTLAQGANHPLQSEADTRSKQKMLILAVACL